MDKNTLLIFLALVFGAVFLLTQTIVVPTFGTGRQESRRLKQRLGIIADEYQSEQLKWTLLSRQIFIEFKIESCTHYS